MVSTEDTNLQTPEGAADVMSIWPLLPNDADGLGLTPSFLHDLILKHLSYTGPSNVEDLANRLGLNYNVLASQYDYLWQEQLIDTAGSGAYLPQQMRFRLTDKGHDRARQVLDRNRYAGPAPVPYQQYLETVVAQASMQMRPQPQHLLESLSGLVFAPAVLRALVHTLHSGRPALLYGPPGDGKTAALQAFAECFDDFVLIPYAIYVQGQVIRVFDPVVHHQGPRPEPQANRPRLDNRWLLVRRPVIRVGGELGAESLDLAFDPGSGFYQAPAQLRAQHGTLVLDDVGRQRIPTEVLINRWMVTMERGVDEITQPSGEVFTIPFDVRLIFATPYDPATLMPEVFLRRVPYKVQIPDPGPTELGEIIRRACAEEEVAFTQEGLQHLLTKAFSAGAQPVRATAPWDLVRIIRDTAEFDGQRAELTPARIDEAWNHYFLREGGATQSVASLPSGT